MKTSPRLLSFGLPLAVLAVLLLPASLATQEKSGVPGPFRQGRSALVADRGLALTTVVRDSKTGKAAVQLVIYSP